MVQDMQTICLQSSKSAHGPYHLQGIMEGQHHQNVSMFHERSCQKVKHLGVRGEPCASCTLDRAAANRTSCDRKSEASAISCSFSFPCNESLLTVLQGSLSCDLDMQMGSGTLLKAHLGSHVRPASPVHNVKHEGRCIDLQHAPQQGQPCICFL